MPTIALVLIVANAMALAAMLIFLVLTHQYVKPVGLGTSLLLGLYTFSVIDDMTRVSANPTPSWYLWAVATLVLSLISAIAYAVDFYEDASDETEDDHAALKSA